MWSQVELSERRIASLVIFLLFMHGHLLTAIGEPTDTSVLLVLIFYIYAEGIQTTY